MTDYDFKVFKLIAKGTFVGLVAGVLTWLVVASLLIINDDFGELRDEGWVASLGSGILVWLIVAVFMVGIGVLKLDRELSQAKKISHLNQIVASSVSLAADLPKLIRDSDRALDLAEQEFKERASISFWNQVAVVAKNLAIFDNTIRQLTRNASDHRIQSERLAVAVTPFRFGMDMPPDVTRTVNRMHKVVRVAHRDHEFNQIYLQLKGIQEQQKTNQILIVGFSSLGQAIAELGDRLESSLQELTTEVTLFREQAATDAADGKL